MSNSEVQRRHLHPVAAAVSGLRVLRQTLWILVLALISGRGDLQPLVYILIVGLPATLIGIGRWLMFQYWIENDELRVEEGLLIRKKTYLPISHVQAVDITAGVVQRLFGLVRVQIKTAAAGNQADLSAVTRAEAQRLQAILSPGTAAHLPGEPVTGQEAPPSWRMNRRQLLLAASTSGQIGVILSGVAWVYTRIDEAVHEKVIQFLEGLPTIQSVQSSDPLFVAAVVVSVLLVTWVLSVAGALIRYGNFTVERRDDRLVVSRGLLERRETAIPVDRIQAIRITESLLRQPFGYACIYVESAGHAEERGHSTWIHPFLHHREWMRFLAEMAPEFAVEPQLDRPPLRVLHRFVIWPALACSAAAIALWAFLPFGWLAFLAVPAAVGIAGMAWRDTGLGYSSDERVAVLRTRRLERVTAIVPRRRAQFAAASQSWFQRRRRVGSCTIGAASGNEGKRFTARDLEESGCDRFLVWIQGHRTPA